MFARAVRKRALSLVQIERKVGHYLDSKGHHFKWTLNGKHGGKPCIHVVERLSLNFALIVKLESWRRHTKKIISQHISPQSQKSRHRVEREKSQMDRWGVDLCRFLFIFRFSFWYVCFYGFRVCVVCRWIYSDSMQPACVSVCLFKSFKKFRVESVSIFFLCGNKCVYCTKQF